MAEPITRFSQWFSDYPQAEEAFCSTEGLGWTALGTGLVGAVGGAYLGSKAGGWKGALAGLALGGGMGAFGGSEAHWYLCQNRQYERNELILQNAKTQAQDPTNPKKPLLHFVDLSPANRKNGTIILLHGFGANINVIPPEFNELAKTYEVIAVDLPGHGQSGFMQLDEGMSNQEKSLAMADVVNDFLITELGLTPEDKTLLIGHSMGGLIAQMMIAKNHEQNPEAQEELYDKFAMFNSLASTGEKISVPLFISAAALPATLNKRLGAPPLAMPSVLDQYITRMAFQKFGYTDTSYLAPQLITDFSAPYQDPAYILARAETAALIADVGDNPEMLNWSKEMWDEQITQPTLIVWTPNDAVVDPLIPLKLDEKKENAVSVEIPREDMGHNGFLSHPEISVALIEDFMENKIPMTKGALFYYESDKKYLTRGS